MLYWCWILIFLIEKHRTSNDKEVTVQPMWTISIWQCGAESRDMNMVFFHVLIFDTHYGTIANAIVYIT